MVDRSVVKIRINYLMDLPVLLIVYNRPVTTARVVEAIYRAKPSRVYIAADGPRFRRENDLQLSREVRRIVTSIDWPCAVHFLFHDKNLGCRLSVRTAIDWFFAQEERGIILEDDTLPHPDFFRFCSVLLHRYENEEKVMAICGGSYFGSTPYDNRTYVFSNVFDPWGWATWARAWKHYTDRLDDLEIEGSRGFLKGKGPKNLNYTDYWMRCFRAARDGQVDSWAYRWTYSIFKRGGLVIYPMRNLVANIGFGPDATHTIISSSKPLPLIADLPVHGLTAEIEFLTDLTVDLEMEQRFYKMRHGVVGFDELANSRGVIVQLIWRLLPIPIKKAVLYAKKIYF